LDFTNGAATATRDGLGEDQGQTLTANWVSGKVGPGREKRFGVFSRRQRDPRRHRSIVLRATRSIHFQNHLQTRSSIVPDEMPEETFCQIFSYDAEGRLAVITHIFPPAECTGHYFGDEDAVSSDGLSAEDVDCLLSGEDEPAERGEAGRDEPAEASDDDDTGTGTGKRS
jgi:hypothetical protein